MKELTITLDEEEVKMIRGILKEMDQWETNDCAFGLNLSLKVGSIKNILFGEDK